MLRARRQPGETQPVQELADRALVQLDLEAIGDHGLQIDPSPAHHAPVLIRIRTILDEPLQFRHLFGRQARLPAPAWPGAQAGKSLGIVAVHPIPQGLPVHPAQPRRLGTRAPLQHQGERQHPTRRRTVPAARRLTAKILRAPLHTHDRYRHQTAPATPTRALANHNQTEAGRYRYSESAIKPVGIIAILELDQRQAEFLDGLEAA